MSPTHSLQDRSGESSCSSSDSNTRHGSVDSNATLNDEDTSQLYEAKKQNVDTCPLDNTANSNARQTISFADNNERHKGMFANLLELYGIDPQEEENQQRQQNNVSSEEDRPWHLRRADSLASQDSQALDPDDPIVTGECKMLLDDAEDLERACLRQMNYKARRKYRDRVRIEFNITCKTRVCIFT